jgi:hypothetical protein
MVRAFVVRFDFNVIQTNSTSLTILRSPILIAFRGCSSLSHITIPKAVNKIGEGAFAECTSIQSVRLPRDLFRIEPSLFLNCKSLTSLEYHPRNENENENESARSMEHQSSAVYLPPKLLSIGTYSENQY